MFNIENAITNFISSDGLKKYLSKTYKKVENKIEINCHKKIINNGDKECLKIIYGEATQNLENFIYGDNKKNSSNSFLKPATLLNKKCGKGSDYIPSQLHDYLAEKTIAVVDLFPLPFPSDYYDDNDLKSVLKVPQGLGGQQSNYLKLKVKTIVDLAVQINVKQIKIISRYKKYELVVNDDVVNMFFSLLKIELDLYKIELKPMKGHLDDGSGGLDKFEFEKFIQ